MIHLIKEQQGPRAFVAKCGFTARNVQDVPTLFTAASGRITCQDCGGPPPPKPEEVGEWD